MTIAITGGGTGGHLAIARAIKEELNTRGIRPIFIGSSSGQDKAWFEHDEGFCEKIFLDSKGVVNKKGFAKLLTLIGVIKNILTCIKLIKTKKIDTVFSVGGYSAAALVIAAIISRKKLYIHEQNAVQGALNKISTPFANAVFSSFDVSSAVKDYPVSAKCFELSRTRESIKCVIFLGGSQGAAKINELALELALELNKRGIKIIHQAGAKSFEDIKQKYIQLGVDAEVFGFSDALQEKIAKADFAIARSGAGTLFELAAHRLPAFFIPYPYAAGNHQEFNAKYLTDRGAAYYKNQNEVKAEEILKIIDDGCAVKNASISLENVISANGAKQIVDYILK
jgi:UDP-N-acetylglucosamine--N-acetylmuramyl-(pentapeptide) pyrophosphoryl-undecaprenol N-acetylglucosamine transferase